MNPSSKTTNCVSSIIFALSILIFVLVFYSCGTKDKSIKNSETVHQKSEREQRLKQEIERKRLEEVERQRRAELEKRVIEEAERKKRKAERRSSKINSKTKNAFGIGRNKEGLQLKKLEEYTVKLAVDGEFKVHEHGELRICIGASDAKVIFDEGMVQDEALIPAEIGQFAKITPFAPDFDISPTKTECIRIHPSGSEVRFTLTPKCAGIFEVSANIELFNTANCTGPSVPKTAKSIAVRVYVDNKYNLKNKMMELGQIFWEKFISFLGALIALLFATLLFLIRRKIKNKTGYTDGNNN
ncbi:hypothetical protein EMN47_19230 [Prolixibacteraceae bacterium JC049]|nr:hypothetical protein [Prolixibacteraceae bacterium JC049]